jgi:hypothetical protein
MWSSELKRSVQKQGWFAYFFLQQKSRKKNTIFIPSNKNQCIEKPIIPAVWSVMKISLA